MADSGATEQAMSSKKTTVSFTPIEEVIPATSMPVNIAPVTPANWEEDTEQDNPQEAYSPTPEEIAPIVEEPEEDETPNSSQPLKKKKRLRKGWRRRKKGREVRIAAVVDGDAAPKMKKNLMPASQFETVLRRRAIRKEAAVMKPVASPSRSRRGIFGSTSRVPEKEVVDSKDSMEGYDEEIGDTSLGMKLNIIGGRVIVQAVNPLGDGRASPAQLSGLVERGDVLLSVDYKSIVNLPLDQLVIGLKPLSTAQDDGAYKRSLTLRFAAGDGLRVLKKNDEKAANIKSPDVFNLTQFLPQDFPMADQLSGLPMFDDPPLSAIKPKVLESVIATAISESSEEEKIYQPIFDRRSLSLNELISVGIAELLQDEKQRFVSEYFAWNENFSVLLRPSIVVTAKAAEGIAAFLNRKELIARGEEAMKGAKQLSYNLEVIDKGKDLRSFKAWSSNASLRSRASTRRRYVMEAASVIGSTIMEEADSDMAVSVGSDELDEMDGLDGDELLTQLAAYDEIWRKQVLETIEKATEEMETDEEADADTSTSQNDDIAEKLSSLFLGEHVNKLLSKKKKSYALPSDEVTCVLFDLVTHLASTTPDEISVKGKFEINPQTSLVPFQRSKNPTVDKDALLATLFVVNQVFPAWLKSFKPLPWAERRVLWPHTRASMNIMESTAGGSLGDDLLTIDSAGMAPSPIRTKKKNLRETIEDMELDVESRAEACFLITFYFTQEILPGMGAKGPLSAGWRNKKSFTEKDALDFVDMYGAYLRLPMALAYAAFLKSELVVVKLLELAKHDPRHLEALKDISKVHALILYEPTMLSAISKCVRTIGAQKIEGRSHLVHLAVSAFPDLRPWLVRKGCLGSGEKGERNEDLEELYYVYLSLLLHPTDGHDAARQDKDLVKEWCSLSAERGGTDDAYRRSRKGNFLVVASRKQPEYKSYRRDLPFLMDLAVTVDEVELALELINEMLGYKQYVVDNELMSSMILHLRSIARDAVGSKPMNAVHLQRAFRMFEKMCSAQEHCAVEDVVSVSTEYYNVIAECDSQDRNNFLQLLASEAEPLFALQSLLSWSHEHTSSADFLPLLHLSLKRSATLRERKELSPALLRIDKARSSNEGRKKKSNDADLTSGVVQNGHLWRLMMSGDLHIDK
mmetsp:Transcript_7430/g.12364  ORF Transcript_7430/g.12364 Transcript_7430/m.12364 type:complete len:1143 (+) Transcript_7430:213-3641(+)|eukprot:CAMPEP_0119003002 /NCGR_PEP_ID=MMETSP1176-20130426/286_1 /TAXON_ID=265551 /ORGANISM="Synedropsis recta cf, Strain CCMP1620" /LENGTH=1142 /DNA_ID=CAMNT_0006954553 /DNA_START=187 /DNA_END=3615 /DNA_ORIENTATION=-